MATKLVNATQLDSDLTTVANAIRTKGGTSASLSFPSGMAQAISDIQTGITPTGTTSITENGTYDVTQYASASVNVSGGGETRSYKAIDITFASTTSISPNTAYTLVSGDTDIALRYGGNIRLILIKTGNSTSTNYGIMLSTNNYRWHYKSSSINTYGITVSLTSTGSFNTTLSKTTDMSLAESSRDNCIHHNSNGDVYFGANSNNTLVFCAGTYRVYISWDV